MSIPIENLYYMLCYAWDRLEEANIVNVKVDDYEHIVNLFARVLSTGLEHLLKRGLDRGYIENREIYSGVRGKIDFGASLKGMHFPVGRAVCVHEDLTVDVIHNQILKRTIGDLLRMDEIDQSLMDELRLVYARLEEVSNINLTNAIFNRVQLHRNNGVYRFLMNVCRMIHDSTVVNQDSGHTSFQDFVRDEAKMSAVFEKFLLNFYTRELPSFKVKSEILQWEDTAGTQVDLEMLPGMKTDISIVSESRRLIIDAKYYQKAYGNNFGKDKVHSHNIYQLFAYLRNSAKRHLHMARIDGILIYPKVDRDLDLKYTIHGHSVNIVTVDLSKPWRSIHERLLEIVHQNQLL